jgi:hypothetical protein
MGSPRAGVTANVDSDVQVGNGAKKRWTNRPLVNGFAVFDVNDAVALEELDNLLTGVMGILAWSESGRTPSTQITTGPRILSSSPSVIKRTTSIGVQASFWALTRSRT